MSYLNLCPRDKHQWKHDQCMVCVLCGECTGYGPACVSSGRPDRNPGTLCGCGSGESGCSECGICRACAGEDGDVVEVTLDLPEGGEGGSAGLGAREIQLDMMAELAQRQQVSLKISYLIRNFTNTLLL